MTPVEISLLISILERTGHLWNPFGKLRDIVDLTGLTINSGIVRDAIASFQSFHSQPLEHVASGIFPKKTSPSVPVTGDLDPATKALLTTARCSCPDYGAAEVAEAGTGNWRGCYGIGPFHSAEVRFLNDPPEFLAPVFNTVWSRVVDAYAELGLLFSRNDTSSTPNIDVSFVVPDGSWIGLAIVGSGQGCQDNIWAKFDKRYKPANIISEWTTLLKHELGHNCGLQHSQGGVMNPYIMPNLPVSWRGDPSYNLLVNRFGGNPVPRVPLPTDRVLALAWKNPDGTYEDIKLFSKSEAPTGIFS